MPRSTLNGQNGKFYIVYILLEGRKERQRREKGRKEKECSIEFMRCSQIIEK